MNLALYTLRLFRTLYVTVVLSVLCTYITRCDQFMPRAFCGFKTLLLLKLLVFVLFSQHYQKIHHLNFLKGSSHLYETH